ncbi:uncharacterized protein LOC125503901 [Dendroctonus ponderosae]|uniref:uncharacterized protein LOC125503901 n=1 Tax=Dendroctonus ponderosae TaxID=77166 RepID=UPI0020351F33|nr:uncharacterized protein LOC125503901 [Dendroctonus ponderosae]
MWKGPGEIVAVNGDSTYDVLIDGKPFNRHLHDLRPAPSGNNVDLEQEDFDFASDSESDLQDEFPDDLARIASSGASPPSPEADPTLDELPITTPEPRAASPDPPQTTPTEAGAAKWTGLKADELEENITQGMMRIDAIPNPEGNAEIRQAKKAAIAYMGKMEANFTRASASFEARSPSAD